MPTCKGCNTTRDMILKIRDVTHIMFEKIIEAKSVPVLICEVCGHMEYIYPRELDFQLRDAYRNEESSVIFKLNN